MSLPIDETWRGEAEVEEPSVATALAGEAAKALVALSHCGAFQPQDEPVQKESAVAQPEGARGLGCPLALTEGRDTLAGWLPNLALGLLCLRLAVPTATLGSEVTYQLLLANKYETSQAQIMSAEVPDIEAQTEEGLGEGFKRLLVEITNIEKKILRR